MTPSLLRRFAAVQRRFLMTPTARLAPPSVSTLRSRVLLAEGDTQFQQPSAQKSFSLDIGTTVGRLGRSVARKGDDFSRFNHFLAFDHHRLVTHRPNVGKSSSQGIGRQSLPFPTIRRKNRW